LKAWRSALGGSSCIDAPTEVQLQPGESSGNELEGGGEQAVVAGSPKDKNGFTQQRRLVDLIWSHVVF
jgi:hypothetical protein